MRILSLIISTLLLLPIAAQAENVPFDGNTPARSKNIGEWLRAHISKDAKIPSTATDIRYWVTLKAVGARQRTRIASAGMSIEEIGEETVGGVVNSQILKVLNEKGFVVIDKVPLNLIRPEDFPDQDGAYHNYAEAQAELKNIAQSRPELISQITLGKSVEGRNITGLRFYNGSGEKPGIAFLGTHHAREHLSTEIPLLLARWLADNSEREDVRQLLNKRDVYIIPMVNPDGVEYDIATGSYRWQRKNMRKNGNGTVGVDLNRNYAWGWGGEGSSGNPASSTYRGPSPFSEPESQAVRDFLTTRPNIRIVISYHTFSELILYPWGGRQEPLSDARARGAFQAMAKTMANWTGYRPMQSSDLYVATGDTCDWAWGELKIFCFTFELTPRARWEGGFYPGAGVIDSTFDKNIQPALYLMDLSDNPYRAGEGLKK